MIKLPDFNKAYDYENEFYLSCDKSRIGKLLAHFELYNMTKNVEGDIVECGVFKGASFVRFAMFRNLFEENSEKKLIGFDSFGKFPGTDFEADKKLRENLIKDAGENSISTDQLIDVLKNKACEKNVELIAGDITVTLPEYTKKNPDLKISLLNLDTDIYEPSVTILEELYPKIVSGGILVLDDYNVFPGETKAVDDYFKGVKIEIKKFPFSATPCYIIKP
ncbi:MAG TPA: TylF/MycF/NovP-related O-methyltransferase [Ignavibacteria bacterium]|nr:TylF/MycF/NovP-related O-methyltransferase [Ignavibacteria bacterium]